MKKKLSVLFSLVLVLVLAIGSVAPAAADIEEATANATSLFTDAKELGFVKGNFAAFTPEKDITYGAFAQFLCNGYSNPKKYQSASKSIKWLKGLFEDAAAKNPDQKDAIMAAYSDKKGDKFSYKKKLTSAWVYNAMYIVDYTYGFMLFGDGSKTKFDIEKGGNAWKKHTTAEKKTLLDTAKEMFSDYRSGKKMTRIEGLYVATVFGIGNASSHKQTVDESGAKKTINVWSFTEEVPNMVKDYVESHPEFGYEVNQVVINNDGGAYLPALNDALAKGGDNAPDIYTAESAFVLDYTTGENAGFAASYKDLGIDVDALIKEAEIADYSVQIGTRDSDNEIIALGYQATGGCFIYRRSIAKDVWGTDDPEEIQKKVGGGSGKWDKFIKAAKELSKKDYKILSGLGDLWLPFENSAKKGWIVDGKLYVDPAREAYLDVARELTDNNCMNGYEQWSGEWFNDMNKGSRVLGYFGPAWLIGFTLAANSNSAGDWAVCNAPVGFFWGGTWVFANKETPIKDKVAEVIEWITLDSSKDGLQYQWANGKVKGQEGGDVVASGKVMEIVDGKSSFLGGQNMFDYFVPANKYANGSLMTPFDGDINFFFKEYAANYANGFSDDKAAVLQGFKDRVQRELGLASKK
ncbi:MAG: hypothetical protein K6F44_06415 [Lachnospiraceae bacterium]|nr:hypothetical protein [Lachnospiraceae bacterium]